MNPFKVRTPPPSESRTLQSSTAITCSLDRRPRSRILPPKIKDQKPHKRIKPTSYASFHPPHSGPVLNPDHRSIPTSQGPHDGHGGDRDQRKSLDSGHCMEE
ncbi:uncharacterized protein LAESUDRAFT_730782 [Laetiporus sulphureus 93-53]|uniref:Uncharacterized protein n=1 Tax=Laetiporus sulphureus 93-53 TaxID=1314785 RepID=A0A165BYL0_9APHY|nr:uncharacterized protein LAESUDRAFT_730782 [Laetiporus sulphureus 93-53]KZT01885.1 hypothetical protein LAESUDRAFT_730782 [Laetiporus sulphureus 93-53]